MTEQEKLIAKLQKENKELHMRHSELEETIVSLADNLKKAMMKKIGDQILLDHYIKLFSASAANLLLDPNPIELACSGSKSGTSRNYLVQIKNIILIKSDERIKNIHLVMPLNPLEGGESSSVIHFNKNGVDWEELLFLIQQNGQFVFRVNRSFAINVYHYTLQNDNSFIINKDLKSKIESDFHIIKTDSQFDKLRYQKRLLEIKQLFDYQVGFALDYDKLSEISQYIKSLELTNEE